MRFTVLIALLMMLIHTTSSAETATSGNLLPNAGTGTTAYQDSSGTIDGINGSTGWTLDSGITNFGSEFEANGTGTVSASGSLLGIETTKESDGSSFTTTENSLDGGVRLNSTTEVQNCEWIGSAYQCGNAQSGQDSYSTTVTILDENDQELATVTQNRNTDAGYYGNTFTYTDTVIYTGEGARKWDWEWTGVNTADPNTTSADGPNLLGAELLATLLDIQYNALPTEVYNEIVEIFDELGDEFEEVENTVEIKEEIKFEEEIEMEEEIKMEESFTVFLMEEEKEEEAFEEPVMEVAMEEEKEEEEPVMEMMSMLEEEDENEEEIKEEESSSESTETEETSNEGDTKQEKSVQSEKRKTVALKDILEKIDDKVKDIDKNMQLKNLVKLKIMSGDNVLEAYNIPFYPPKDIYLDQVDMTDNRVIYTNELTEYKQSDPIFIQNQQINIILQERQKLIQELEVLQNG